MARGHDTRIPAETPSVFRGTLATISTRRTADAPLLEDEVTTLQQDLLEASASADHRSMAIFQAEQAEHYHEKMRKVAVWRAAEVQKPGANHDTVDEAVTNYAWEMQEAIHRDMEQFREAMLAVKEQRDRLIVLFCNGR